MEELNRLGLALQQPEYIHALLHPLPIVGLGFGILALILALLLRSREARITGLILIVLGSASVKVVEHYGEEAYDRVLSLTNETGQKLLEKHSHRAEKFIPFYYATFALALAALYTEWKKPRWAIRLSIVVIISAILSCAAGAWIAHAGGPIRHTEFRV